VPSRIFLRNWLPHAERSDESICKAVRSNRIPGNCSASSSRTDPGNSGKPDACTGALGEAEIKASGQTPGRGEKFRRFGKAESAFTVGDETPGKSPTKSNRWNMGWNAQQYSIYGGD
jgi:hypothetical protein